MRAGIHFCDEVNNKLHMCSILFYVYVLSVNVAFGYHIDNAHPNIILDDQALAQKFFDEGVAAFQRDEFAQARNLFDKAVKFVKPHYVKVGEPYPFLLNDLALAQLFLDEFTAAERTLNEAEDVMKELHLAGCETHFACANTRLVLLIQSDDLIHGADQIIVAANRLSPVLPDRKRNLVYLMRNTGLLYLKMGDLERARDTIVRAHEMNPDRKLRDHDCQHSIDMAHLLLKEHKYTDTFAALTPTYDKLKIAAGKDEYFDRCSQILGCAYLGQGKFKEAFEPLNTSMLDQVKRYGKMNSNASESQQNLARTFAGLGQLPEAEAVIRSTIVTQKKVLVPHSLGLATSYEILADILERKKDAEGAKTYAVEAKKLRSDIMGKWRAWVAQHGTALDELFRAFGKNEKVSPIWHASS